KTTPIPTILRELSTPPAYLLLKAIRIRHVVRLWSLNSHYPLVIRIRLYRSRDKPIPPSALLSLLTRR
ncbi:hypothetical protein SODALDRAFT_281658, partial [Sodiomyces alkalinus F11]